MPNVRVEELPISRIQLIENNPRQITDESLNRLVSEIEKDPEFLIQRPPLVNCISGKYFCYAGSQRIKAQKLRGQEHIRCFIEDDVPKEVQDRRMVLDNTHHGIWDFQILQDSFQFTIEELKDMNLPEIEDFLIDSNEEAKAKQTAAKNALSEAFGVPPFSIIDTRQKYWQERKRNWTDLGINSQESREQVELMAKSSQNTEVYNLRNRMRSALGREPDWDEVIDKAKKKGLKVFEGASIFDPVLCEILYKWFAPDNGKVLDPFAGGSVRGIVASESHLDYVGIDLRSEQVEANRRQAEELNANRAKWICGDSKEVLDEIKKSSVDFVFSCPPYHDLEKYSDDESDLSNMDYDQFIEVYSQIIAKACEKLRNNRFACFVVSEIRGKDGYYKNFVKDTIEAFEACAGVGFYNEIILINQIASAAIRAGRQFNSGRKVTRVHQNVLVFFKGDHKKITEYFPKLQANINPENLGNST